MKTLILIVALAIGASAAWAGQTSCQTHCEKYGYCYTTCNSW